MAYFYSIETIENKQVSHKNDAKYARIIIMEKIANKYEYFYRPPNLPANLPNA